MDSRLADKVTLITEAGSGIGRAAAVLFASEGAKVVVNDRVGEAGEDTTRIIAKRGGLSFFAFGDVSMVKGAQMVVNEAVRTYGKIDVLFNNAGGMLGVKKSLTETSKEEWDRVLKNNLQSTFLMCKYVLPFMIKEGSGIVINMGSLYGLTGVPDTAAYCTAKAAIVQLTRQMALDYGRYNIRVNCFCPGPILTPTHEKHLRSLGDFEQALAERRAATALGYLGSPEDIARAALYLASKESSFATGSVLVIDGGYDPRLCAD